LKYKKRSQKVILKGERRIKYLRASGRSGVQGDVREESGDG